MRAIVALVCLLAAGCRQPSDQPTASSASVISATYYTPGASYESLRTISHDGHWFVVWKESQKGGLLHHPGCPKCSAK
jgi:hypothetical protein